MSNLRATAAATPSRVSAAVAATTTWVSASLFAGLLVLNLCQVVARQLGGGWIWVTDLSQLMLLWMVMLGTVAAYCRHEHVVTGFLDEKLTGRALSVLLIMLRGVEIVFFLILVSAGLQVAGARNAIPYVQLGISTSWTYLSIPVSAMLLVVAALTVPLRRADGSDPLHVSEGVPA